MAVRIRMRRRDSEGGSKTSGKPELQDHLSAELAAAAVPGRDRPRGLAVAGDDPSRRRAPAALSRTLAILTSTVLSVVSSSTAGSASFSGATRSGSCARPCPKPYQPLPESSEAPQRQAVAGPSTAKRDGRIHGRCALASRVGGRAYGTTLLLLSSNRRPSLRSWSPVLIRSSKKEGSAATDVTANPPSGRRDSNPRPPEPHSPQQLGRIRRSVAFTRCSGHRRRIPARRMGRGVAGNSQRDSQRVGPEPADRTCADP
jgi:hypothetical protein